MASLYVFCCRKWSIYRIGRRAMARSRHAPSLGLAIWQVAPFFSPGAFAQCSVLRLLRHSCLSVVRSSRWHWPLIVRDMAGEVLAVSRSMVNTV